MKIFLYSLYVLVHREWKRFVRQRSRLFSSLLTPLMFWALLGMGFGKSFRAPYTTSTYLEYFFPGVLMMTLLFSAIFSMISLIDDRNEGFLQGVMVSPVSHRAIIFGKILGAASLSVAQSLLLLPFAKLAGLPITWVMTIQLAVIFIFSSIFMCSVSFFFAWKLNSSQGFHAVMNILLFPMWILSGAMFPIKNSAVWLQWVMKFNPLTYAMEAAQRVFYMDFNLAAFFSDVPVKFDMIILTLFCVCFITLSLQSVQKSYR